MMILPLENESFPIDDSGEFLDSIRNETARLASSLNNVREIFDTVELVIVCFGLVANFIGSITLLKSRHMATPSFVYHKALGLTNLVYCFNFILVKTLRQYASEQQRFQYTNAFETYATAYYMGVVSRAVASTCGYFVMYTSLLIIADRFLALVIYTKYHRFNKLKVAVPLVALSLFLSCAGHSWAPWIENQVKRVKIEFPTEDQDHDAENIDHFDYFFFNSTFASRFDLATPMRLTTLIVYAIQAKKGDSALKTALSIKDMYNLVIRLTYAAAQTGLTLCVIRAFHSQGRKRRALKISPARTANNTGRRKSNVRRERSLSYLMLAVAFLSCAQVLPREFKRVFDLIYPIDGILPLINDRSLSIDSRRRYMLLAVYGHGYWKLIANVLTAVERSLLFYLYFILNYHFRAECLSPFVKLRAWILNENDVDDRDTIVAEGRSRCRSLTSPNSAKTSTNTMASKSSIIDQNSISTAIWINRRLSFCVMGLYAEKVKLMGGENEVVAV